MQISQTCSTEKFSIIFHDNIGLLLGIRQRIANSRSWRNRAELQKEVSQKNMRRYFVIIYRCELGRKWRICEYRITALFPSVVVCKNNVFSYINVLILPMTDITAPARRIARLLIRGQKAPMRVTHNLPKISAAERMEMQRAESALEKPNLRTTNGNSVQYVTSAKKETAIPIVMLTYTGSSIKRRSRKSTTADQNLENLSKECTYAE